MKSVWLVLCISLLPAAGVLGHVLATHSPTGETKLPEAKPKTKPTPLPDSLASTLVSVAAAELSKKEENTETSKDEGFGGLDIVTGKFITDLVKLETREAVSIAGEMVDTLKKHRAIVPSLKKSLANEKYQPIKTKEQLEQLCERASKYRDELKRQAKRNDSLSKPVKRLFGELLGTLATKSPNATVRLEFATALLQQAFQSRYCCDTGTAGVDSDSALAAANAALDYAFTGQPSDEDLQRAAEMLTFFGPDFFLWYFITQAEISPEKDIQRLTATLKANGNRILDQAAKAAKSPRSPSTTAALRRFRREMISVVLLTSAFAAQEIVTRKQVEVVLRELMKAINENKSADVVKLMKGLSKQEKGTILEGKAIVFLSEREDALSAGIQCLGLPSPAAVDNTKSWTQVQIELNFLIVAKSGKYLEKVELTLEKTGDSWFFVRPN